MLSRIILFLLVLAPVLATRLSAQGEANYWYFGHNAGIHFSSGTPAALTNGMLYTDEGCASISTSSGSLLFYTDGVTVWNNQHSPMPNGTGLMGDVSSTQSAIIVPKPGNANSYYIFTTTDLGGPEGLRYSEVDMALAGGLGDVTAVKNVPLATPVTEKLTAVKHGNNTDYWVIAHDKNTDAFLVYAVTAAGVNATPVISNTGLVDPSLTGGGYLKASPDGSKLATALQNPTFMIEVLDFNNMTGVVTSSYTIPQTAYGVEFSPDGTRLYAPSGFSVIQYDLTLATPAAVAASATTVGTSATNGMSGIQSGPDGKIYISKTAGGFLACIPNPNALGAACGFIDNAVDLLGMSCVFGLPNFITSYFTPSIISYSNTCFGDSTLFSINGTVLFDSVMWYFDDPASGINNTSQLNNPVHIFTDSGSYTVSLVTYTASVADTATVTVIIAPAPAVSLGNDTSLCPGTTITLNPGSGYISYQWQNGSTLNSLQASSAGTYWVAITDQAGCSATDSVIVSFLAAPVVNLGPDTSICSGTSVTFDAGNGFTAYTWQNNSSAQTFSTTSPGIYWVTVTDSSGCSDTDSVSVNVFPAPFVNLGNDTVFCAPFSLILDAGSGFSTYLWQDSSTNQTITATNAGTYWVKTSDSNGCTGSDSIKITAGTTPDISLGVDTSICNFNQLIVTPGSGFTSYLWHDNSVSSSFIPSQSGTYWVSVTNASGCMSSDTIKVIVENCECAVEVPKAFSPNADGHNDVLFVRGSCIQNLSFVVYDRWGEKVFETNNPIQGWDGRYKDKEMNTALFGYYLKAIMMDGKEIVKKGNISLIR